MKKIIVATLTGLLFSSSVYADGWWYHETPGFLQFDTTEGQCEKTRVKGFDGQRRPIIRCLPLNPNAPREYNVVATDGSAIWVDRVDRSLRIDCAAGICKTEHGEYVGRVSTPTERFWLVRGHYLYEHDNGEVWQYRRGTGPAGDTFPLYKVDNLEGLAEDAALEAVPESAFGNISLHCNPMNETCYFNNEIVYMEDLPQYFSMADVDAEESEDHFCDLGLCWSKEGGFIGLNPFHYE